MEEMIIQQIFNAVIVIFGLEIHMSLISGLCVCCIGVEKFIVHISLLHVMYTILDIDI